MDTQQLPVGDLHIAMWCSEGLEALINLSLESRRDTFAVLSTGKADPNSFSGGQLEMMKLRAQMNSQRCYEIYAFWSTVDTDTVRETFADNPQPLVEWIRKHGEKIYSDHEVHRRKLHIT